MYGSHEWDDHPEQHSLQEAKESTCQRGFGHALDLIAAGSALHEIERCVLTAIASLYLSACATDEFGNPRPLTDAEITRYVALDQPEHCAGAFKVESLGTQLFERMAGEDYTSLIGLPLILLGRLLAQGGVDLLACASQQPD